jgi:K+-sensing histidine kinase KdpD
MAPIRLVDVIRAALGEVEDFQRVQIERMEPATLMGTAAADLAHVMAELVENALIFSPPHQVVEVRGWSRHPGYTLAVVDSGLGMGQEELTRANRRLAGFESFTVAPSKYLGHYVAGALAARHGIRIQLVPAEPQGIVATVDIPGNLVDVPNPLAQPLQAPADWNGGGPALQPPLAPSTWPGR